MPRTVAMLRGINVGGRNKVAMSQLRELFARVGFLNTETYLQSGNVVFDSGTKDITRIGEELQRELQETLGLPLMVLIRTAHELDELVRGNPFLLREHVDPSALHVTFLAASPTPGSLAAIPPGLDDGEDQWSAEGANVYVYCPNGYGRTKLNNGLFERKLKTVATTRNWKTVLALRDMAVDG
ncbi:MAG: DUF1697 domain-containing protein [Dehalococcoidia bacterium]